MAIVTSGLRVVYCGLELLVVPKGGILWVRVAGCGFWLELWYCGEGN